MKISEKSLLQLEWPKLLKQAVQYCKSPCTYEEMLDQGFETDMEALKTHFTILKEVVEMIEEQDFQDIIPYENISEDIYYLKKEGYVLETESVLRLLSILENYQFFKNHFTKERVQKYRLFYTLFQLEDYSPKSLHEIKNIFDEEGNFKRSASKALEIIFKKIDNTNRHIDRQFNESLEKFKSLGFLSETAESWRNGRRVLVLAAENKNKIRGIIHDQSSSGKTVFIEPDEVARLNNELSSLENEKRVELHRILRALSAKLHEDVYMIEAQFECVKKMDILRAKGIFSKKLNGHCPELIESPTLQLKRAYHPLLYLQNIHENKKTVSFDLELHGSNHLLLISGPNAGGKSVTLKAVGLIHLMVYFGLYAPLSAESKLGPFDAIFTDIGDQQSIDEGLSTYSSHLSNLSHILDNSNNKSLILLDEIGSGTDPKLGGAIAEGILEELRSQKVFGVVTTHYSSLKIYAFNHPGIVNGAMLFDKEKLAPSYVLKVGKPGSSYAYEVANQVGLDKKVLKYARKQSGKNQNEVEDLLIDLQESKAILEDQLAYIANEKQQLARLIRSYEDLSKEYQVKRKKLQIRSKEIAFKKASNDSLELTALVKRLEKDKQLEKAKELQKEAVQKREEHSEKIVEIRREIIAPEKSRDFKLGDHVKMYDSDMSGQIERINSKKATVVFGMIKMEIPLEELILARPDLEINRKPHINVQGVAFHSNFSPKLDIRGYKLEEAGETIEEFIDKAFLNNAKTLEVVHGKGSGALKKLVWKKFKSYSQIESIWHPVDEQGGSGVTLVKI